VTTPLRRRVRRARRLVAYGGATLVILAAFAVAIANQMLPVLARHPADVARWLGERIGRPVALDSVEAHWTRRGPLLGVTNLRIGQGEDVLEIGEAELQVNAYAGFLPNVPLTIVRVRGPDLVLDRNAEGRWRLEGLAARPGGGGFDLRQLDGLGELQIENARLRFTDAPTGGAWSFDRIDARLRTVGDRFAFGIVARVGEGTPLRMVADMDRELQDGRVWIGGEDLALGTWIGHTPLAGIELVQGTGDLGLWLEIAQRRLASVRVETRLEPVALRGTRPLPTSADPADPQLIEPRYGFDRLAASLRWQRAGEGWTLDIGQLDIDAGDARTQLANARVARRSRESGNPGAEPPGAPPLDSRVRGNDGVSVQAALGEFELGPLLSLAMLSDKPSDGLRRWLYLATPRGKVSSLRLDWSDGEHYLIDADIDRFGWQAAGKAPGVDGLRGTLRADAGAASFALEPGPLTVTSPLMFRAPMVQTARGTLNAWPTHPGWRVEAAGLDLKGEDWGAVIEGGIWVQGDGTRPFLDLRATVAPGPVVAAKKFWILNKMPPKAVHWLDEALVSGQLAGGRAIVHGDADFWPFRENEGRLEARADLADLELRFRNDWPAGKHVTGSALFVNTGLSMELSGDLLGNRIEHAEGAIEDLKNPILELDVAGGGSGETLLALMRSSPLQRKYGEYFEGLRIGGEAAVAVDLHIPLKDRLGALAIDGTVDLQQSDLHDDKWGLDFEDATGRVRFSERGFSADELRVGFAQGTGALSIAVGGYTSDEKRVAEASVRGRFAGDALLQPYESLRWLQPYLDGNSEWSLQLNVPAESTGQKLQTLRVRSDLAGTALSLPAPLRKQARERLPLDLTVQLPVEDGAIDLRLGSLLRLRGTLPAGGSFTGVAAFGDAPETPPPAQGIVAVGQMPVLDAAGWAAFSMSGSGDGPGLQRADLYVGELDLLDRAFAETRVKLDRNDDASLAITFEGQPLQGSITIPTADLGTRGISATFERLHWPSGAPQGASALSTADPAVIPPLRLAIGDFRFGEAALGKTELQTYPTPEGLHVEKFDTTAKGLELRARGDWGRIGGQERSNFRIDFDSPDLGAMLKVLGFSELISGGVTKARLQATWPGAPSAFELDKVHGLLTAEVGKGRVLEVNPGAGRIFGLLSLTEIPRRLALDFSDFFKSGLAFNHITGSFTLDGGNAYTDDLEIVGPAAEIRVRGRTGLKLKDYDQTMEVLPRASSVLPAIGAIAAGPAGAAIGAVAQAMFQSPLKQMARTLYRVQGSWDEPRIDVIDRGPAPGGGGRAGRRLTD
jgi:uncharacterized protein (TIGR02099 family)